MRFAAYLNAGTPSELVAEQLVDELLQCSNGHEHELSLEVAKQFVLGNLSLIGVQCDITPQQIRTAAYKWPESLRAYIFPYNAMLFRPFAKFLRHISNVVLDKQKIFDSAGYSVAQSSESGLPKSPIFYLLELLGVWYKVCTDLEKQEDNLVSPRFEEPLARINFHLLMGLHPIRKQYRSDYQYLDTACHRLYVSALSGIFYTECHVELVDGLSTLFSQDFDLFYNHSVDSMDFFYETLSVVNQTNTYVKMFKIFQQMLSYPSWTQSQLLILTNCLIEEKMQEVYFTYINLGKNKRLLLSILEFLKMLQNKLPTVDCFSKTFIESLWTPLLNQDKEISSLAADTYVIIMERKFDNPFILNHILEGYFQKMNSPKLLEYYIEILWLTFPHMHNVDVYINLINNVRTREIFRAYTAHFLVEVYKQMLKDYAKFTQSITILLLRLPQLLRELSCEITVGILLQIYAASNFEDIKCYTPDLFMDVCRPFEDYAFSCFTLITYGYPVMLSILTQLNRCLYYTKDWSILEKIAGTIFSQFREIEKKLNNKKISTGIIQNYEKILQQLSLLLQTGYDLFDHLVDLLKCIQARLIENQQIYEIVSKEKSLHDVYAIEILTFGLRKLADSAENASEKDLVKSIIELLSNHLLSTLRNIKHATKISLLRIKTLYCSYIQLHYIIDEERECFYLKLTARSYQILVDILILINFDAKSFLEDRDDVLQYQSLRNLEYQQLMFDKFIKLHNIESVDIPSHIAWKLCIYFGLPNHKFDDHVAKLLKVIGSNHFNIYKHILPVLVFKLYKRQPALNHHIIQKALKAHNDFIVTQLEEQNPNVLKVHIILTVLQIVEKYVDTFSINSAVNRLDALKHLNVLVADLEWTDKTLLKTIIEVAEGIKKRLLTADEINTLHKFKQYFEKCL